MDAYGAADPANGDQEINEIRLGGKQLTKFVDHDEQMWELRQLWPLGPQLAVMADRRNRACVTEQLLPSYHLTIDAGPRPLGELGIVGEVVDDAGNMR